jgi:uncharacterized protein
VKLQHRFEVLAQRDRVWAALLDVPAVASCVPGVEEVQVVGPDRYRGRFRVGVGPIRLSLEGEIGLEILDAAAGRARLRGDGTDPRLGGGVRVLVTMTVVPAADDGTSVVLDSDVQVLGRIGELGQPVMKRKADEIIRAFAACLAGRLG